MNYPSDTRRDSLHEPPFRAAPADATASLGNETGVSNRLDGGGSSHCHARPYAGPGEDEEDEDGGQQGNNDDDDQDEEEDEDASEETWQCERREKRRLTS